jgi:hypothetical protein
MHGRRWIGAAALLAVVVLGLDALRAPPGAAEDAPAAAWIFDTRIVRVDAERREVAESAPSLLDLSTSTVRAEWPALLEALKARGTTRVLLDQRVTAFEGHKAQVEHEIQAAHLFTVFASQTDEQRRSAPLTTGAHASYVAQAGGGLDYEVVVNWALAVGGTTGNTTMRTRWTGTHGPLGAGETLVLHHRAQGDGASALPPAAEIYAFVTARRAGP